MKVMDSNTHKVKYAEIFLPASNKNGTLKLVDKTSQEIVLSEAVVYYKMGDTVNYYSNHIDLPRPIIVNQPKCWTNTEGAEIPRNQEYKVDFELDRLTKKEGQNLTRTLVLRDVSLENTESKEKYSLPSAISSSKTMSNLGGFKDRAVTLSSNDNLKIDLGGQFGEKSFEYSTIISGKGSPSYMLLENIYGTYLEGVITSCNEIDTLKSENVILPESIQIGMDCQ